MQPAIQFFHLSSADSHLPIDESRFEFRLCQAATVRLPADATSFAFVAQGDAQLKWSGATYPLRQGMYVAVPGDGLIEAMGSVLLVAQHGYRGLFSLGGPIEAEGRLRYIDGCSDTLLISPVVMGDACLNFLRIPPHTNQTSHTHPSFRFGMVVAGSGYCDAPDWTEELHAGKVFFIPREGEHRFRTAEDGLSVIAFHPDSDFGPEDDNHPMVNKTIVNGVPAAQLSHLQRGIVAEDKP